MLFSKEKCNFNPFLTMLLPSMTYFLRWNGISTNTIKAANRLSKYVMEHQVAAEYCFHQLPKRCIVPNRVKKGALRTWYTFTDTIHEREYNVIAKLLAGQQWDQIPKDLRYLNEHSLLKRGLTTDGTHEFASGDVELAIQLPQQSADTNDKKSIDEFRKSIFLKLVTILLLAGSMFATGWGMKSYYHKTGLGEARITFADETLATVSNTIRNHCGFKFVEPKCDYLISDYGDCVIDDGCQSAINNGVCHVVPTKDYNYTDCQNLIPQLQAATRDLEDANSECSLLYFTDALIVVAGLFQICWFVWVLSELRSEVRKHK
eukprot:NODE_440_length_7390_cov_0.787546.p1 type:complete len:318 gc:universal NODE_440_length_7390_cov_0.787546:5086-6039(+)